MAAVSGGARCATHPQDAAVEVCRRCGSFVCGSCLQLLASGVFCPPCYERSNASAKASPQAIASLVLGLVGLNCMFVPGVVGLVLAQKELRRIEEGSSPEAGRNLARGGRILGWINVVLLAVVALCVVAVLAGLMLR